MIYLSLSRNTTPLVWWYWKTPPTKVSRLSYYKTMLIPAISNFDIDDTKHHLWHQKSTRSSDSLIFEVTCSIWYHQYQNCGWLVFLQWRLIFNVGSLCKLLQKWWNKFLKMKTDYKGRVAEWSKALVLGTSQKWRGFESHPCQNLFYTQWYYSLQWLGFSWYRNNRSKKT